MQALWGMLFSTTGGSTLPSPCLPYLPLNLPIFFSSLSPFICHPPLFFSSCVCCFQVQVAGCNLSNMSPSPFYTVKIFPEPTPCLHSPVHIWPPQSALFSWKCMLHKLFHLHVCVCVHCSLVNDPSFSFPPTAFRHEKCISAHSPFVIYLCQLWDRMHGGEWGLILWWLWRRGFGVEQKIGQEWH